METLAGAYSKIRHRRKGLAFSTPRLWAASLILGFVWPGALKLPQPTTLPLVLVGIVGRDSPPARYFCLVRWAHSPYKEDSFGQGERAFDLAEIRAIGRNGVIIRNLLTKNLEYLGFSEMKPDSGLRKPPPPRIVAESPDSFQVIIPEETVEFYVNNISELLDSAFAAPRSSPAAGGGEASGFEIRRIRKDGIVDHLGLRDGDVILEANGQALDGLPIVMKLAGEFLNARRVTLAVLREGKIVRFIYNRK